MIDIKRIREDAKAVKDALKKRNEDTAVIDEVAKLDEKWRDVKTAAEKCKAAQNKASKQVGRWIAERKSDPSATAPEALENEVQLLIAQVHLDDPQQIDEASIQAALQDPRELRKLLRNLGGDLAEMEQLAAQYLAEIEERLLHVPNLPLPETPVGENDDQNVVRKEWGERPTFDFTPKAHWDLVDGLELEIGGRITGSGFPFLRGPLARLERAMLNFFIDTHTRDHGYTECWTPFMVRGETLRNSGQLPKFVDDMYRIHDRELEARLTTPTAENPNAAKDGYSRVLESSSYLIPTAEVPLTSVHAGEIIKDEQAPIRYCAFTPCFRREAGAAGKDTRGILRVHQFSKVEMMVVTTPEQSAAEHETLTRCAESVLEALELPYRRLELCTGDLGFGAARCYDLEAYAAGVDKWLEVSSCSNFTDFQARRAKIRVRDKNKNTRLAHTLNGSGLAVPRTMIALLENNQQADGTIKIPKALQPYYGGEIL